eukprot:2410527-Prymnesium_polylepis.2
MSGSPSMLCAASKLASNRTCHIKALTQLSGECTRPVRSFVWGASAPARPPRALRGPSLPRVQPSPANPRPTPARYRELRTSTRGRRHAPGVGASRYRGRARVLSIASQLRAPEKEAA